MIYTEIYVPPTAPAHYLITGLTRCSRYCTPTPPHGNLRSCTSECTGGALIRGRAAYVCMGGAALLSPPPAGVPTRPHLAPSSSPPSSPLLLCRWAYPPPPETEPEDPSFHPSADQVSRGGGAGGEGSKPTPAKRRSVGMQDGGGQADASPTLRHTQTCR